MCKVILLTLIVVLSEPEDKETGNGADRYFIMYRWPITQVHYVRKGVGYHYYQTIIVISVILFNIVCIRT